MISKSACSGTAYGLHTGGEIRGDFTDFLLSSKTSFWAVWKAAERCQGTFQCLFQPFHAKKLQNISHTSQKTPYLLAASNHVEISNKYYQNQKLWEAERACKEAQGFGSKVLFLQISVQFSLNWSMRMCKIWNPVLKNKNRSISPEFSFLIFYMRRGAVIHR